ncbi:solute carrier family 26 member 6-like isoform X1 [Anabas testudineus]|uniref:STAS domain-containing protein n=1 Tax=Anabas testudineus TaxID=64144 RepID=A0A7N6BBK0_ANATE|nr:solute carrier family 26 member 6-like isoform X1 [Anabas testudineus]
MEYFVQREILDDDRLDNVAQKGIWVTKPTIVERVKDYFRCSLSRLKLMLFSWFPILHWLPQYPIKEYLPGDIVSGASIFVLHLPQGLAYAPLAGLSPVYGLYASFYPVLIYVIFGTSRHLSVGTFAVTSIMVGNVVQRLAPDSNFLIPANGTNGTVVNTSVRDHNRLEIVMALTILMGIYQILLSIFRFGFMVSYLSEPMVRAYTTGSAVLVCVSQLKPMFGVLPGQYTGPLSAVYTVVDVCRLLPKTKIPVLIVTIVSLAVLIAVKEINTCFRNKLPLPIPIELLVIIFGTIIAHFGELKSKYGVNVVGLIPSGMTAPFAPSNSLYSQLAGDAFAVGIVSYVINISLAKTFAQKLSYKVDNSQELMAVGIGNVFGGFFQSYAATASLSRTLVQESTGGQTQVAGIISSILMLIAILKIGSLFEDLPTAILATIVVVNLKGMFMQFVDLPMLWRTNKVDLLIWLVTFVAAVLLNLDLGLGVAVGFAIITVIFRTQLPHYSVLGHVPGTDLYLDIETYKEAKEIPGIKIFRSSTTIYYTNAEMYVDALQEKCGIDIRTMLTAKRKQEADLKRQQQKEEKRAKKEAKRQKKGLGHLPTGPFTLKDLNEDDYERLRRESQGNISEFSVTDTSTNGHGIGQVNWAYQHDPAMMSSNPDICLPGDGGVNTISLPTEEENRKIHTIILDISTISFVDTVTSNTLKNIFKEFGEVDFNIYLAGAQVCVVKQLETAGFFSDSLPKSKLFVTVHDAVLHVQMKQSQTDLKPDDSNITKM